MSEMEIYCQAAAAQHQPKISTASAQQQPSTQNQRSTTPHQLQLYTEIRSTSSTQQQLPAPA